ncbi:MAG: hypothetical protein GWO23_24490 [Gammaproteobacteria bacterium]|nr:hypothetical protein [Gammaproteobacteria bacterium]
MIKYCKMNWETETHSFIFETNGSWLDALDGLKDITGSLNELYEMIILTYRLDEDLPPRMKIVGTSVRGIKITDIWDD